MVQNLRALLESESKSFLAADILVSSSRPWTDEALSILDEHQRSPEVVSVVDSVETTTMVRTLKESAEGSLVELRAVQDGFPLYGRMELDNGTVYSHALLEGFGAVVRPELLTRLGISLGDRIWIGEQDFEVRAVLVNEAGRSMRMFALGPRVLIDHDALQATGILSFGSRLQHQRLLKVRGRGRDQGLDSVSDALEAELADEFVRVRTYREAGDQLTRRLSRGENYLSLAGFVVLLLGGTGVWSVIRVFVHERRKTVAILKCVGAKGRDVVLAYIIEVAVLALGGSLFGVVLARALMAGLSLWLQRLGDLRIDLELISVGLTGTAIAQGVSIGLVVAIVFSLSPLLALRRVRPGLLLQPESDPVGRASRLGFRQRLRQSDRWEWTVWVLGTLSLLMLVVWQAGSLDLALRLSAGFVGVSLVLVLVANVLKTSLVPLASKSRFALRHAVLKLTRGSNQTVMVLLAVGLGCFLVLTIRHLQQGILAQFAVELDDEAADMFFIDVQSDQVETVRERAKALGATQAKLVPVLRARVASVDGKNVQLPDYEAVREKGSLGREYTVTYRDTLDDNEEIVDGDFWGESERGPDASPAEVSIEDGMRRRYDIEVGDTMTFDIMGRLIPAKVTSLRDVNWDESRNGGFVFVFRPEGLQGVPASYAGFIKAPEDGEARAQFQREIVGFFPNVSIIDLRDILASLAVLVDKISIAISIVGYMSVVSGVLILIGSVAMTRYQRRYETAVFRTLGASRRKLVQMMWIEYATLGLLAGIVGAFGAAVTSWVLSQQVLEVPYRASWFDSLFAIVFAVVLVSLVGLSLTREVVRHKPLEILRAG